MNRKQWSLTLIGLLIFMYILQQVGALDGLISTIGAMPLWLVAVLAGILFSGWQFLKATNEEEEVDQKWIEEQGEVYIKRMEEEKSKRAEQTTTKTDVN